MIDIQLFQRDVSMFKSLYVMFYICMVIDGYTPDREQNDVRSLIEGLRSDISCSDISFCGPIMYT